MTANMYLIYHKDLDAITSTHNDTTIEIQECDRRSRARESEGSLGLNTGIITHEYSCQDSMCRLKPIRCEDDPGRYASRFNSRP